MQPPSAGAFGGGIGPTILAVTWAEGAIGTFMIGLRIYTGSKLTKSVYWDYFWAIAAFVCGMVSQANVTASIMYGLGNHADRIETSVETAEADINGVTLFFVVAHIFSGLSVVFGKVAITALLLRLEGPFPRFRKWILHFVWASNAAVQLMQELIFFTMCLPSKPWYNFANPKCSRHWIAGHATDFQVAWSALTDTTLALWPIFLFFYAGLTLSFKKKLGLCFLMGGGLITASINVAMEVLLQKSNHGIKDWLELEGLLEALRMSEMWSIIILGSIPSTRIAFVKVFHTARSRLSEMSMSRFARRSNHSTMIDRYVRMDGSNQQVHVQQAVEITKTYEVVRENKAPEDRQPSARVVIVRPCPSKTAEGSPSEK